MRAVDTKLDYRVHTRAMQGCCICRVDFKADTKDRERNKLPLKMPVEGEESGKVVVFRASHHQRREPRVHDDGDSLRNAPLFDNHTSEAGHCILSC